MALIVNACASGAPGLTTTLVGLALNWPTHVLLSECDREPAQSVLAGYLQGTDPGLRGLGALAQAHRERRPLESEVLAQAVPLDREHSLRRSFLPGFSNPAAAPLFLPVWADLAAAFAATSRAGIDVLVDAGRIGPALPSALLAEADLVVVWCRSGLRSLAGLRLYLPAVVEALADRPDRLVLGVIGPDQPYSATEIQRQFATDVAVEVADAPALAAVYSEGRTPPRKFPQSGYVRSLRAAASRLITRVEWQRREISGGAA